MGTATEASRKLSAPAAQRRLPSAGSSPPPPREEEDNPACSTDPSAARARRGTRCPSRTIETKSSQSCPRGLRRSKCRRRRRPSSLAEGEAAQSHHRTGWLERRNHSTSKTRRTEGGTGRRKRKPKGDEMRHSAPSLALAASGGSFRGADATFRGLRRVAAWWSEPRLRRDREQVPPCDGVDSRVRGLRVLDSQPLHLHLGRSQKHPRDANRAGKARDLTRLGCLGRFRVRHRRCRRFLPSEVSFATPAAAVAALLRLLEGRHRLQRRVRRRTEWPTRARGASSRWAAVQGRGRGGPARSSC